MQIGAAEVAAGVAGAAQVERAVVVAVAAVADLDVALGREQPAVARVAGRHHAVEHVDAGLDAVEQVFRRAHAHQVARLVGRQPWCGVAQHAQHLGLGLAHRQAADRVAVEADVGQAGCRLVAQRLEHPTLHDAEQRIRVFQPVECVAAAARPAQRQPHRVGRFALGGWPGRLAAADHIRRALVEDHRDVRVQHALDAHRLLGRQQQLVAIDRRGEAHAVLGDLAQRAQREHLEAAGVGQDRPIPAHEAVQAAVLADHVQPWPQPQMEGVAEHDLGADLVQLARRHRLDRAVGAHRHEDRRLHHAVVQRQRAAARLPLGAVEGELQAHRALSGNALAARSSSIASP